MRIRNFGESALEYELLCWVRGPTRAGRARHELLRVIDAAPRVAGIEIPYPKRDVVVTGEPAGSNGADAAPDPAGD
ncbi:MAG: hypothetical protein ABEJ92_08360 [Halobacteriales archaeon]